LVDPIRPTEVSRGFAIGDAAVDPVADVAGGGLNAAEPDGTIDGTDFIEFINGFSAGCWG
jgi:hypothetical protein